MENIAQCRSRETHIFPAPWKKLGGIPRSTFARGNLDRWHCSRAGGPKLGPTTAVTPARLFQLPARRDGAQQARAALGRRLGDVRHEVHHDPGLHDGPPLLPSRLAELHRGDRELYVGQLPPPPHASSVRSRTVVTSFQADWGLCGGSLRAQLRIGHDESSSCICGKTRGSTGPKCDI